ncbi:MAG: hypothetical protein R2730_02150 [Chitinophagales bacterium]
MKKLIYCALIAALFLSACSEDPTVDDPIIIDDPIDTTENPVDTTEVPIVLDPYADWMKGLLLDYPEKDIAIRDISYPSAHDAGTYLFKFCTGGANACNTRTQDLNMTEMLEAGVRGFDIRPVFANDKYFTQHVTECDGLGCRGDWISSILEQTRAFLDHHSELVLFSFGHFCSTSAEDQGLLDLVYTILGDRLYRDSSEQTTPFMDRPLENIIPPSDSTGKAIIQFDGVSNTAANREKGIFSNSYLPVYGSYANSHNFNEMKADQLQKFNNYNPNGNQIFGLSWTMTLDAELSIACAFTIFDPQGIEDFANIANNNLASSMEEWRNDGTIVKGKIPNIIALDFADKFVTDECLKMTLFNIE